MSELIDSILKTYGRELEGDSRAKISRYLETLTSAGTRDSQQLMRYGLAYLFSEILRVNEDNRSARSPRQRFDRPHPIRKTALSVGPLAASLWTEAAWGIAGN
jgi:hypothetical protein